MRDGSVVIETDAGIGFLVNIAGNSPFYKKRDGEEIVAYTHMIVREDDMSLYGFESMEALNLFKQLISVSGIGPKAGMAIMGVLPMTELKTAIASGNSKIIATAPGVGKKSAERVILELKDKMDIEVLIEEDGSETVLTPSAERDEAVAALISLGYSVQEAKDAIYRITDDGLNSEDYIKKALRNMV